MESGKPIYVDLWCQCENGRAFDWVGKMIVQNVDLVDVLEIVDGVLIVSASDLEMNDVEGTGNRAVVEMEYVDDVEAEKNDGEMREENHDDDVPSMMAVGCLENDSDAAENGSNAEDNDVVEPNTVASCLGIYDADDEGTENVVLEEIPTDLVICRSLLAMGNRLVKSCEHEEMVMSVPFNQTNGIKLKRELQHDASNTHRSVTLNTSSRTSSSEKIKKTKALGQGRGHKHTSLPHSPSTHCTIDESVNYSTV